MSPVPPAAGLPEGPLACPRCGTAVVPGARFCPTCGAPLPTVAPVQASASADPDGDAILRARLAEAAGDAYEVLGEVGRGGMAVVFLAWDRALARHAALKVLRPVYGADPLMAGRFLQEGRTAAGLDAHPGVVRVYGAREARGLRYLVMQYVDGCSLDELLAARGPLPADLTADVVDQVARALDYAHARGVVHRDVKPGNVLLARDGLAAVTDFGIAKAVAGATPHSAGDTLARTGFRFGTPAYMSPEHWRDEPLTPVSDQYALGVVAYHLLAGRVPFSGSLYAVQQGHLHQPPPPIAGVPPALWAVVARMLAKRPADRFSGLAGVSDALEALPHDDVRVLRVRAGRLVRAVAAEHTARRPALPWAAAVSAAAVSTPPADDAAMFAAGTVRMPRPAPPAVLATARPTTNSPVDVADDPSGEFSGVWSDPLVAPPRRRPRQRAALLAGVGVVAALGAAAWAARGRDAESAGAPSPVAAPTASATPPASPAPSGAAAPPPATSTQQAPAAPTPTGARAGEVAPAVPVDPPDPPAAALPALPPAPSAPRPRESSAAPRRAAARPAEADVQLAVRQLVASVAARDVGALGRRLAPRAGDGTRARDFLLWLRSADRLRLTAPATRGAVALARGQARVAVRVPLRWRATAGPLKWPVRRDVVFWLTLAPDGGRWRGRTVTLASRFPP